STCMYYTEKDPFTRQKLYVAKSIKDKALQRVLLQYSYPQNQMLVFEALRQANRLDLVGFGKECLIRPISSRDRINQVKESGMDKRLGRVSPYRKK
ncbi:MAG: DUF3362 domain-containing protein, partial [Erysipelotrichaceae bacterium]